MGQAVLATESLFDVTDRVVSKVSRKPVQDSEQTIVQGDCLEVLKTYKDCTYTAIVTDPPAGISFMGKAWDHDKGGRKQWIAWMTEVAAEALRVCKPGAHALVWALPRTAHWTATAWEDAGWEVRDVVSFLFGQGFPKAHSPSKVKGGSCECSDEELRSMWQAGKEVHVSFEKQQEDFLLKGLPQQGVSEQGATRPQPESCGFEQSGLDRRKLHRTGKGLQDDSHAGTPTGTGQRLCVGTHSGDGNNVGSSIGEGRRSPPQEQGQDGQPCGKLGTDIGPQEALDGTPLPGRGTCPRCGKLTEAWKGYASALKPAHEDWILMRKPLDGTIAENCVKHGCGALNIDGSRVGDFSNSTPSGMSRWHDYSHGKGKYPTEAVLNKSSGRFPANLCHDSSPEVLAEFAKAGVSSSPARFFASCPAESGDYPAFWYGAKAGRKEKEKGLEGEPEGPGTGTKRSKPAEGRKSATGGPTTCSHPTVKSLSLMRWLLGLVKMPSGNLILDPFAGSFSTLCACKQLGIDCVGIEKEAEYVKIGRLRLSAYKQKE